MADGRRLSRRYACLRHVFAMTALVSSVVVVASAAQPAAAASLPPGFQEEIVFSGLTQPTAVRFSPDGRVFVAEKSGIIKVFDNLSDTTPTVFADLRTQVHNFWDRGLLGLALGSELPDEPVGLRPLHLRRRHRRDRAAVGIGGRHLGRLPDAARRDRATAAWSPAASRGSRRPATSMIGSEQVLIEDWCQQYPSHSIGSLAFGADGALYVSGGDGASFNFVDYGQDGAPRQPVRRPARRRRRTRCRRPTAEGGALRSQDLRTTGDPTSLDGTILRVDPATGAGLPDNPMASSSDANARRIVAYGLRNPFRITTRPGHQRGLDRRRRLERVGGDQPPRQPDRGTGRQLRLAVLRGRRPPGRLRRGQPHHLREPLRRGHRRRSSRRTSATTTTTSSCPTTCARRAARRWRAPRSPSRAAARTRPSTEGALFFADYTRRCIWAIPTGTNGLPDISKRRTFVGGAAQPVDLADRTRRRSLLRRPRRHASAASATSTRTSRRSPSPPPTRRAAPRR